MIEDDGAAECATRPQRNSGGVMKAPVKADRESRMDEPNKKRISEPS